MLVPCSPRPGEGVWASCRLRAQARHRLLPNRAIECRSDRACPKWTAARSTRRSNASGLTRQAASYS